MPAILSTIIVNYNAGAILHSCIESLLNCPLPIQIIVVDNNSTDNSLQAIDGLPNVQIIKNNANLGFAVACNIGVRVATAPNLLFLNPDCFFKPDAIDTLLAALHSDEQVGMVGALMVNEDGTEQAGGRRAIPTPWRSFVRAFGLMRFSKFAPKLFNDFYLHKEPLPDHPITVEAISGSCIMVKRSVADQVGLWDEGYFLHCEDLDWCMRFRQGGWKILFVPGAEITHTLGACSKDVKIFVEWHKHKGMVRFYRKFFRNAYPTVVMWMVIMAVWFRFGIIAGYTMIKQFVQKRNSFRV